MAEHHQIAGSARGEPRPSDCVGARVRVPLDSAPTPAWSRVLGSHLTAGLTGHPAVGHLRLAELVQGADIVLDGVEAREAALLGPVLQQAIDAANRACEGDDARPRTNMPHADAQEVAQALRFSTGR